MYSARLLHEILSDLTHSDRTPGRLRRKKTVVLHLRNTLWARPLCKGEKSDGKAQRKRKVRFIFIWNYTLTKTWQKSNRFHKNIRNQIQIPCRKTCNLWSSVWWFCFVCSPWELRSAWTSLHTVSFLEMLWQAFTATTLISCLVCVCTLSWVTALTAVKC